MADSTTLARPYARAVFDIAESEGSLAEWDDFLRIAAAAVEEPALRAMLDEPSRTPQSQAELLAGVFPEAPAAGARNMLRLLAQNERLFVLPEIAEIFGELRAAAENTVDVEVTSVETLDEKATQTLTEALRKRFGRDIKLVNVIDPDIIGGVVVRAGDLVIDGSARTRLERLASRLRA